MTSTEKERIVSSTEEPTIPAASPGLPTGSPRSRSGAQALAELLRRLTALRKSAPAVHVLRASAWSVAGYGVSTVLRFVSRLALAKFLHDSTPMGDVAIVVVILAGLEMISDLGIGINIVQHKRGEESAFLGTAFSVQAIRGVGLWAIASLLAAPIAWLYHSDTLTALLLFGALATLLRAFANPGLWVLTRRVDLKVATFVTIASEVAGFLVTITWSILSPSAWAIVAGSVAGALVYTAASHLIHIKVRFAWDKKLASEIARFGGWMVLSSATYFFSSRGETLMLRGSIPDAQFGVFAFASMLVTTPVAAISQLASQVFFPTLASSIRGTAGTTSHLYIRAKWAFAGIAFCFVSGGMFLGPPIVHLLGLRGSFVGLEWMVQLLALRAALDIYAAPTTAVLFASGASRYSAIANVVRLIFMVLGLFIVLDRWGLRGAFVVLIGAQFLSYIALMPGINKHMPGALRVEATSLVVLVAGSALATAAAWTFRPLVLN